jgi:hypothetical protein
MLSQVEWHKTAGRAATSIAMVDTSYDEARLCDTVGDGQQHSISYPIR